ncbi:pyrimidine 5'-nucleotidase [Basidiobolus meristosporus CBS 931.73]|uniref:Pyrimidine 5'-nucleotidase n=1 Tax=Basidiobolus meristosporus CBS 931.73 TaxID=1314790 RepID=A0A1Y1XXP1_9FUNG|nr:pyrimidine 5'-nucleotidase [Basidiobolus meristosporus CBS 931.73]|eukprot:ORX90246.1 pyrimidine 5'-nucleotidase [Basidiobolus meristosporus CBS 931.73]
MLGVFFFDVDNCLYSPALGIYDMMCTRIRSFVKELGIPEEEVIPLCSSYSKTYGMTVRGLLKFHNIDPMEYDRKVDGSLPLEELISPNPELRAMLQSLPMKKWAFTNAALPHAKRVLSLLGIEDQFQGITYCDYAIPNFLAKPDPEQYHVAMAMADIQDPKLCYLVDDSEPNICTAKKLGWTAVRVATHATKTVGDHQISEITELPKVLPELWE